MATRHIAGVCALLILTACQTSKKDIELSSDSTSKTEKVAEATDDAVNGQEVSYETTASVSSGSENSVVTGNTITSYVAPKAGTVFTWRNNWANLPEIISYKVSGTLNVGGHEYLKLTSIKGFKSTTHAYYSTQDFSLKGYRDAKDKALVTYKPVEKRYQFPMAPGNKWLTQWRSLDHKTERVTAGGGVVHVIRMETLELPAGKFKTMKVKMPVQKNAPKGLTHHAWFSPELGITVKEQIGGGVLNWTQVLEKVEYPE